MGWLSRLFGQNQSPDEIKANRLYDALVLEGGPGGDSSDFLNAASLGIELIDWQKFSAKRLLLLEAFYYVSYWANFSDQSTTDEKFRKIRGRPSAMEKRIQREWSERGIALATSLDVAARCFDYLDAFSKHPIEWSRGWLHEFYPNDRDRDEFSVRWAVQCQRQFEAMKLVHAQLL